VTCWWATSRAASSTSRPHDRKFLGQLKDPDGEPIHIRHLWALKVGNGGNGGRTDTVYFTAGIEQRAARPVRLADAGGGGHARGAGRGSGGGGAVDVVQLDLAKLTSDISSGGASVHQSSRKGKPCRWTSPHSCVPSSNSLRTAVTTIRQRTRAPSGAAASARDAVFADLGSLDKAGSSHNQRRRPASAAPPAMLRPPQDIDRLFAAGWDSDM